MEETNLVRVSLSRELTDEEVQQIIEIVDEHAYVTEETTVSEDTCEIDSHVNIAVGEQGDEFVYEIPIIDPVRQIDARFMAEKVAELIEDDFELGASYDK